MRFTSAAVNPSLLSSRSCLLVTFLKTYRSILNPSNPLALLFPGRIPSLAVGRRPLTSIVIHTEKTERPSFAAILTVAVKHTASLSANAKSDG